MRGSFRKPFQEPLMYVGAKLPPDLVRWLDEGARLRKVTRTKLIYDHLRTQQRIQEQLAESFTLGADDGEGTGKQILHAALARHTETVARTIDREVDEIEQLRRQVAENNQLIRENNIMIDRLVAVAAGLAGYKKWREDLQIAIKNGGAK